MLQIVTSRGNLWNWGRPKAKHRFWQFLSLKAHYSGIPSETNWSLAAMSPID
jgi:hypothetical protein